MAYLIYLSKEIRPNTSIILPINLVSIKPIILPYQAKPNKLLNESNIYNNKINHLKEIIINKIKDINKEVSSDNNIDSISDNSYTLDKSMPFGLYYDPFEARRAREKIAKEEQVLWSVDTICGIRVIFNNPLNIAIQFDKVLVLLEDKKYTTYTNDLTIPPLVVNYEVDLSIMPDIEGLVKIKGIQVFLNNSTYTMLIDDDGSYKTNSNEIALPSSYPRKIIMNNKNILKSTKVNTSIGNSQILVVAKLNYIKIIPGWLRQEYNSLNFIDVNGGNDGNNDNHNLDLNDIEISNKVNKDINNISSIDLHLHPGEYLKETIKLQSCNINDDLNILNPTQNSLKNHDENENFKQNTSKKQPLIRDIRITIHENRNDVKFSYVVKGFSSIALTSITILFSLIFNLSSNIFF